MAAQRNLSRRLPMVGGIRFTSATSKRAPISIRPTFDGLFQVRATLRNTTRDDRKAQVRFELLAPGGNAALHEETVEVDGERRSGSIAECFGTRP